MMPTSPTPDATPNVVLADALRAAFERHIETWEATGPGREVDALVEAALAALRTDQQEGEGWATAADIRLELLGEVAKWGSQSAVAARIGVTPAHLSYVLARHREPGPKIAKYLGRKRVTLYALLTPPKGDE